MQVRQCDFLSHDLTTRQERRCSLEVCRAVQCEGQQESDAQCDLDDKGNHFIESFCKPTSAPFRWPVLDVLREVRLFEHEVYTNSGSCSQIPLSALDSDPPINTTCFVHCERTSK